MTFTGNNNRIDGYPYDSAGNLANDGSHAYTYDAESRITKVDGGSTGTYVYDAAGRRVRKTTASGGTVDFLYDLAGHEIAEINSSGGWNRLEVYAGGRHLATYTGGTGGPTYFIHSDWLGTERARSNASGGLFETCTSLPFGDWLTCSGSDVSPMHFTGKERDSESGLDNFGARYDSSSLGRFMTPDWSASPEPVPYAKLDDPQSLNLYAYVRNNPLNKADLDGHNDYTWQKLRNWVSRKGYRTDAQVKGLTVAQTARNHKDSMDWAEKTRNISGTDVGHPQVFKNPSNKCNEFVGDTLAEAGKTRPEIKDKDGNTRMPTAHEFADPTLKIPGLSAPQPLSDAKPGDVIAQAHGDWGHAGIVVGPGQTASVNTAEDNGGKISVNAWGFRSTGQNGESETDPAPVVRHPE